MPKGSAPPPSISTFSCYKLSSHILKFQKSLALQARQMGRKIWLLWFSSFFRIFFHNTCLSVLICTFLSLFPQILISCPPSLGFLISEEPDNCSLFTVLNLISLRRNHRINSLTEPMDKRIFRKDLSETIWISLLFPVSGTTILVSPSPLSGFIKCASALLPMP